MKKVVEAARRLFSNVRAAGAKSTSSQGYSVILWGRSEGASPVLSYCSDRNATIEDHALVVQMLTGSAVRLADDDKGVGLKPVERWGRSGRERLASL